MLNCYSNFVLWETTLNISRFYLYYNNIILKWSMNDSLKRGLFGILFCNYLLIPEVLFPGCLLDNNLPSTINCFEIHFRKCFSTFNDVKKVNLMMSTENISIRICLNDHEYRKIGVISWIQRLLY